MAGSSPSRSSLHDNSKGAVELYASGDGELAAYEPPAERLFGLPSVVEPVR